MPSGSAVLNYNPELMQRYVSSFVEQALKGVNRESLPYIRTYSGKKFRHLWPLAEDVCIEDIAHHLARLCRFAGAVNVPHYSVAQHSVYVSLACNPEDARSGLLHDASEAYCVDIPRPLKRAPGMEFYRYYENKVSAIIEEAFGLPPEPESVKTADLRVLAAEKRDLYRIAPGDNIGEYGEHIPEHILPMPAEQAESFFLARYIELFRKG